MVMRKLLPIFIIVCFITFCFYVLADAGEWDQCKVCHNGNLAPHEKDLKEKYKTVDKFVEAAKRSEEPLMDPFKKNEKLLREAAKDIGLK
jgi:hypothetical protein